MGFGLLALVVLCPAWWLGCRRRTSGPLQDTATSIPGWQWYRAADPVLPSAFLYPASWSIREERGRLEPSVQLRLLGVRNGEDTYTCFISIRSRPVQAAGGLSLHITDLIRQHTERLLEGAIIDDRHATHIAGLPAEELTVSYTIPPLYHQGLKPLAIPVTTRTVLLERGGYGYELVYSADAREYARYEPVFNRVLASLQFE